MKRFVVYLMLLSCLCEGAAASVPDSTLSLDLQMRVRTEWRDGYKLANDGQSAALLNPIQRNRMGVSGGLNAMQFKMQLQSIRSFFGRPTGTDQVDNMSLTEAWVQLPLLSNLRMKVGRQKVAFDDERIVGAINWSNPGRFLDGIRLHWKTTQGVTSAVLAWDEWSETQRWMLHHEKSWNGHRVSILIFDQHSVTEPTALTAGGTWSLSSRKGITWNAEAYTQFKSGQYAGYMLIAGGQKAMANGGSWKWGADWMSGENGSNAFHPFLGTNHKFYGWMDHFYVGVATAGLMDLRLERKIPAFQKKAMLGATLHHFRNHSASDLLAHELDVWLTGQSRQGIQWHVGWSIMDPTENHISRQGEISASEWASSANRLQQWGWVSVNFAPSILLK